MTDSDRWRGDGSAERERILKERDNTEEHAPQITAEEVERRNAEILREMQQRTIDSILIAAGHSPDKQQYYHAMWRAFRALRGGNSVCDALIAAAALDGVQLEDEQDE